MASAQGYYNGNSLDGDYIYVYMWWSQSGNVSTVHWEVGWAFRNPSPTDREIKNGHFLVNGGAQWDNGGVVHPNRGQYWEHDEALASGQFNWTHDADGNASFPFDAEAHPYYNYNYDTKSRVAGTITLDRIAVKPSTPGAPTLSNPKVNSLDASWSAPSNGGSSITGYDIQYDNNSDFSSPQTTTSTGTTKTITGLSAGTKYYVRVRAKNAVGAGSYGSSANKITLPAAPTGLALSASTTSGMTADWADTTSATGYDIQYGVNSDFSGATTTTSTSSTKGLTGLTASKKYYVRVRAKNASGAGAWSSSANRVTIPVAPTSLVLSNAGTTTLRATWVKPAGGSEITNYDVQWDENSSFSSPGNANSADLVHDFTGLNPGTKYYVRVRAENAIGAGAYSSTASATTLPADPPGLKIASSADGKSATLTFSPPGGVTGVDKYDWERRVKTGSGSAGNGSEADTSETVSSLTPGTTYEWRASAWIDSYQSPWSSWIALTQAKPNTSAGDYFDGDTTDTADMVYSWTGTAENSTSIATGSGVKGWGYATSSGAGAPVMYRITGGTNGSKFSARVQITADMVGAGLRVGQKNADPFRTEVTADATYVGSIYVRPSRSQLLAAEITWLTDAGVEVAPRAVGAPVEVPGDSWVRLAVGAVAPAGAARAVIRTVDVTGTGWSVWLGGDVLDVDSAMISLNEEFPYFDGSTPANSTYVYEWDDPSLPHESISKRTPVEQVGAAGLQDITWDELLRPSWLALTDPDCEPVPPPPRPPAIPSDCIEDVGVWRRYYTEVPADYVPDWMDVVPTVIITSGPEAARQLRIRYHANPDGLSTEDVPVTEWIAEQIISFMPAKTVMTLDGVTQRVWAEVNGGNAVSADHLLYGTNGQPATWPLLSCGIAYLITVDVPIAEDPGNITIEVALTARV